MGSWDGLVGWAHRMGSWDAGMGSWDGLMGCANGMGSWVPPNLAGIAYWQCQYEIHGKIAGVILL